METSIPRLGDLKVDYVSYAWPNLERGERVTDPRFGDQGVPDQGSGAVMAQGMKTH